MPTLYYTPTSRDAAISAKSKVGEKTAVPAMDPRPRASHPFACLPPLQMATDSDLIDPSTDKTESGAELYTINAKSSASSRVDACEQASLRIAAARQVRMTSRLCTDLCATRVAFLGTQLGLSILDEYLQQASVLHVVATTYRERKRTSAERRV